MHDYQKNISRHDRYEQNRHSPVRSNRGVRFESRRNGDYHDSYHGSKQDYREYKPNKWVASRSRYEHSRSRSPAGYRPGDNNNSSGDNTEMAGLIFMCNKKTQRRCLAYNVLGMPMAKKHLADRVSPGMKLFLFEFESRQMYGIYEAVTYAEMDLEPKAFVDANIQFPLQVRFRILEKCLPLRENQFKDAILTNYFEPTRFRFELTRNQVFRLLDLFRPLEVVHKNFEVSRKKAPYPEDSHRSGHNYKDYSNSHIHHNNNRRDEEWKKEQEFVSKKPVYYDNRNTSPPRVNTGHHHQLDYSNSHTTGPDSSNIGAYEPEYKRAPDYKLPRGTASLKQRYEGDGWPSTATEYTYIENNMAPTSTSLHHNPTNLHHTSTGLHHANTATTAYAATIPSKYDTVPVGYTIQRPEQLHTLQPAEAERYWKEDTSLQLAPDTYAIKPSLYTRQGIPIYGDAHRSFNMDAAGEDAALRLAGKKTLLEVDYIPVAATSGMPHPSLQLGQQTMATGKEIEYNAVVSGYGSDMRRVPMGYAENGIDPLSKQQAARYGYSSNLPPTIREEAAYQPTAVVNIPSIQGNGATFGGDRYTREISPRYQVVEDARYVPGSYRDPNYFKGERAAAKNEEEHSRVRTNGERQYEIQQATAEYRHIPDVEPSPDRGIYRKPSVWDRVSGIAGPRGRGRDYEHKSYSFSNKRPRELSHEPEFPDFPPADDGSRFPFDFKRRHKGNDLAGTTSHNNLPRKRRFVRPDAQYSDRLQN